MTVLTHGCDLGETGHPVQAVPEEFRSGRELLEKDRKQLALKAFDKAVAQSPANPDLHLAVATILMEREYYKESIPYIKRGVSLPPNGKSKFDRTVHNLRRSQMYTILGDCYQGMRQLKEAETAYRKAVRLDKENATAYNNWGYMYAEIGIHLDKALELSQHAVDLEPDAGSFVDSLGWTYFQLGKEQRALRLLKRAAELSPSTAEVRYHLARAYEAVGDEEAAWVEYAKVLKLSPSDKSALQRIRALEQSKR